MVKWLRFCFISRKSNQKQVLGRGLSAILNDPDNLTKSTNDKNANETIGKIIDLPIENIITKNIYPADKQDLKVDDDKSSALGAMGLKPKIVH